VVGGLVEQQHVGLGQQQPAERHAAALAAGQVCRPRHPRAGSRSASAAISSCRSTSQPFTASISSCSLPCSSSSSFISSSSMGSANCSLMALKRRAAPCMHPCPARRCRARRAARRAAAPGAGSRYVDAGLGPRLALELGVDAGHDAQQRRLARAVQAQHADLGAGKNDEPDVLEDHSLRRHDLGDALHGVDVLGHGSTALLDR
jgi:hypothetical protein